MSDLSVGHETHNAAIQEPMSAVSENYPSTFDSRVPTGFSTTMPSAFASSRASLSGQHEQPKITTASDEKAATAPADDWKAGRQEWLIMLCLAAINTMVALDASVIVPPLPAIATSINANAVQAFWVGTSYLIPYAVFQPFVHALSDTFGRMELLVFAIISFTIGSIVGGVSHNITQMIVGRVIQGIGGGGVMCMTSVIITDIIPLRQRPKFLAIPQLTWALGNILGPLIGGALANSNWRWVFYINFPFCGIGLVMSPLTVKLKVQNRVSLAQGLASVDYIGAVLFIGGLTTFLLGLSWGGLEFSWSSPAALLPLILGLVVTIIALVWEARFAPLPFLKLGIFQDYSASVSLVAAFLQGFLLYLGLYIWNLYFQGAKGKSPIGTGVAMLPIMTITLPSAIVTGRLIARTGKYVYAVYLGWALITLGNGLVILWDVETSTAAWVMIEIVTGIGQGIILIAGIIALQTHVPRQNVGNAAAMYSFLRALGTAVGVGIGGAIFQNRLRHYLLASDLPSAIALNIEGYIRTLNTLPASEAAFTHAVRVAIANAHSNVFMVTVAVAGLALVLNLGLRHKSLNQALASRHTLQSGGEKPRAKGDVESRDVELTPTHSSSPVQERTNTEYEQTTDQTEALTSQSVDARTPEVRGSQREGAEVGLEDGDRDVTENDRFLGQDNGDDDCYYTATTGSPAYEPRAEMLQSVRKQSGSPHHHEAMHASTSEEQERFLFREQAVHTPTE